MLLSSSGLVYRAAWQVERKSAWLLLFSQMTCISRSHMMLSCSLWSVLAWEALWASTSLMAVEQAALASRMIQSQVVLASLTTAEQAVLASRVAQVQEVLASKVNWEHVVWALRVTQEQTALASLIDSAAWDSFLQSSIPSSQMALHLWASVDALVVS